MLSTTDEQLQPLLPMLARMLGHRPSPPTVWRWQKIGVKAGDRRVKLRTTRIGGKLYGTPTDVMAFIAAQNQPAIESNDAANDAAGERSPETEARLEEAGLL